MRTIVKQAIGTAIVLLLSRGASADQFTINALDLLPDQHGSHHPTEIWSSDDKMEWNSDGSIAFTPNSVLVYDHTEADFRISKIFVSGTAKNDSDNSSGAAFNFPDDLGIDLFEADPDGTLDPVPPSDWS